MTAGTSSTTEITATGIGWLTLLGACAACYVLKLLGHLAPTEWLRDERVTRVAALVTVALLSALLAVATLVSDGRPSPDARLPAVGVAAVLLWRRTPFIVVVGVAAVIAAALRRWA